MTTRRKNGVYYVKRSFSGIGQVYRSLGTKNAGRAHALEAMLISLHDQGRVELVQTFLDGDVTIEELASYYETNRIHELSAQLNNPDTSLSEACKDMLRLKAPDVGAKTLEGYRTGLGHFQRFAQSVAVATVSEALTKERIQEFKAFRLKDGVRHETINNDLIAISNLVTHALDQDWITKRPTIKRYKSTTRISYLEPTRLDMYFAALRAPLRPLFRLLVDTGMRLGEVQALRACDLRMGEETRALIQDAKTPEGVRPVFLPPETAAVLLAHIEEHGLLGTDQLFTMPRRSIQKEPRPRLWSRRHPRLQAARPPAHGRSADGPGGDAAQPDRAATRTRDDHPSDALRPLPSRVRRRRALLREDPKKPRIGASG